MSIKVSIINGMGSATITGSEVVLTGADESDFMHIATDFIIGGGVQNKAGLDLYVQPNSPAGMSVRVNPGTCYVSYGSFSKNTGVTKYYRFESSSTETATITANSSGSTRIDLVCAKVDPSASGDEGELAGSIVVVAGTPGAGVPATPSNYLKLAEVTVANGASSITAGNITEASSQVSVYNVSLPSGTLINGKISVSVSSNNLTLSLLTLNGETPSATNSVQVKIGNYLHTITSAKTVTKNAGTNWGNAGSATLATKEVDWFAYLGYNATDGITIGFSRIPYAQKYGDFSATTTNDKYAAISTISNATSTDGYVNIGRFAATLSATASFNWSVPTYTESNLIQRPIYETRVLEFVPQFTANGGGSFTPSLRYARYKLKQQEVTLFFNTAAHTVSGTVSTIDYTLPFTDAADSQLGTGDFVTVVGIENATNKTVYEQFIDGGVAHKLAPIPSGNFAVTAAGGYLGVKTFYYIET